MPDSCTEIDPDGRVQYYDETCDGVFDRCEVADAKNYLLGVDEGCDGTFDSMCYTIVYDDLGRMIRSDQDENCDGVLDRLCTEYVYAPDGQSYTWKIDRHCSGDVICEVHSVYPALDGRSFSYQDNDCDGVPDGRCSEVIESETGGLQLWDDNCDGEFDECDVALDGSGNVIASVDDTNCSGAPTMCTVRRSVDDNP